MFDEITGKSRQSVMLSCLFKQYLTFRTLLANSAGDKLIIFFLFFPENRTWHFMQIVSIGDKCKLSPLETICMKCQILFPMKNKKKYFKMLSAEKFTQSAKC